MCLYVNICKYMCLRILEIYKQTLESQTWPAKREREKKDVSIPLRKCKVFKI